MHNDQLYRDHILDLWQHPHNFGVLHKPDVSAEQTNILCGDTIRISGRITNDTLSSVLFDGHGCVIAIAAASIVTDFVNGKSVKQIQLMQADDVLMQIEVPISPARLRCALLSFQTLQAALHT